MRTLSLSVLLVGAVALSGCVVHHRRHNPNPRARVTVTSHERHHRHHESSQGEEMHSSPPPARTSPDAPPPPPPPRDSSSGRTHRAPPAGSHPGHAAPPMPAMTVQLDRTSARRGENVVLTLHPFRPNVMVFFNGRVLPKRTKGNTIEVTVPGNAQSGVFEVQWQGERYRSSYLTVTQ